MIDSPELRLVLQVIKHSWGSDGLELIDRRYVLQYRFEPLGWKTCAVVDFAELPQHEQAEIVKKLMGV